MALIDEARSFLADLVAFPTVSSNGNLALIDYVAKQLNGLGAPVQVMPDTDGGKANLFTTIGPEIDGGIILSGHSDVVPVADQPWTGDPFRLREEGGRLIGRGSCDMKGYLACVLAMAPRYAAMAPRYAAMALKRPVHVAITHDEEVGCIGARRLIEDLRQMPMRPAVAIIGEPTEMRIVHGHKGCFEYTTLFTGLDGHGSNPAVGVNAVEYAVRYAGRLMDLADELRMKAPADCPFEPPFTTLQIGKIEGGHAHNVIPGHCTVQWEMRPVQMSDANYVKERIRTFVERELLPAMQRVESKASIEMEMISEVDGLDPKGAGAARDLVADLLGDGRVSTVPFGTEAGLFQAAGISAVVCGPGSIEQAHKPDEFIEIDQIQACLDLLDKLGQRLQVS